MGVQISSPEDMKRRPHQVDLIIEFKIRVKKTQEMESQTQGQQEDRREKIFLLFIFHILWLLFASVNAPAQTHSWGELTNKTLGNIAD